MKKIKFQDAIDQYGGSSEAETILNMAKKEKAYRIYKCKNNSDDYDSYVISFSSDIITEEAIFEDSEIIDTSVVFKDNRLIMVEDKIVGEIYTNHLYELDSNNNTTISEEDVINLKINKNIGSFSSLLKHFINPKKSFLSIRESFIESGNIIKSVFTILVIPYIVTHILMIFFYKNLHFGSLIGEIILWLLWAVLLAVFTKAIIDGRKLKEVNKEVTDFVKLFSAVDRKSFIMTLLILFPIIYCYLLYEILDMILNNDLYFLGIAIQVLGVIISIVYIYQIIRKTYNRNSKTFIGYILFFAFDPAP